MTDQIKQITFRDIPFEELESYWNIGCKYVRDYHELNSNYRGITQWYGRTLFGETVCFRMEYRKIFSVFICPTEQLNPEVNFQYGASYSKAFPADLRALLKGNDDKSKY
jgi:hypothetical protein